MESKGRKLSRNRALGLGAYLFPFFCLFLGCLRTDKIRHHSLDWQQHHGPWDAVIIPGIPYQGKQWDSVMKSRVLWSWVIYRNGWARNIIYSGGAVHTPFVESKIMAQYGKALGIPEENIFCETQAEHSVENIYYSYQLAQRQGWKSLCLATDPFQSRMLMAFIRRRFATPIQCLPIDYDSIRAHRHQNPPIDPVSAFVQDFRPLNQVQGFWQRWKGTFGSNLPWPEDKKLPPLGAP